MPGRHQAYWHARSGQAGTGPCAASQKAQACGGKCGLRPGTSAPGQTRPVVQWEVAGPLGKHGQSR